MAAVQVPSRQGNQRSLRAFLASIPQNRTAHDRNKPGIFRGWEIFLGILNDDSDGDFDAVQLRTEVEVPRLTVSPGADEPDPDAEAYSGSAVWAAASVLALSLEYPFVFALVAKLVRRVRIVCRRNPSGDPIEIVDDEMRIYRNGLDWGTAERELATIPALVRAIFGRTPELVVAELELLYPRLSAYPRTAIEEQVAREFVWIAFGYDEKLTAITGPGSEDNRNFAAIRFSLIENWIRSLEAEHAAWKERWETQERGS